MHDKFPTIGFLIPELMLGDEKAWTELCEGFRPGLLSRCRLMLRHSKVQRQFEAEDLIQELFVKAWKKRETFRGTTTAQFAKWLLVIMRNGIVDRYRQLPPETSIQTWFGFSNADKPVDNQLLSIEQEAALHACLSEMDERYRQVVCMRHFEGLKFAVIAESLGVTSGVVAGVYRRGLAQLVEMMEQRGMATGFV